MRVGDVEVLVETRTVAGTEQTSGRMGAAAGRVAEGFDQVQETITAVASRVAGTVGELARRSMQPDRVEVEFGLSFAANGNVIVVGGTVEATLKVTLAYDGRPRQAGAGGQSGESGRSGEIGAGDHPGEAGLGVGDSDAGSARSPAGAAAGLVDSPQLG